MEEKKLEIHNIADYKSLYEYSIKDPESFWSDTANQFVSWFKKWNSVSDCDFSRGKIQWFKGGILNASYNCLDRHLETHGDQVALIWEANTPNQTKYVTYKELYNQVCKFANVLKSIGVKKGDRICIYPRNFKMHSLTFENHH